MLKDKIEAEFKKALKEKKEIDLSVLRLVKTDIFNKEKEKRYNLSKEDSGLSDKELEKKSSLTDEELMDIILSKVKRTKESIAGFQQGKREDLVKKEEQELQVLKKYMPEQLSEQEIKKMCEKAIQETDAKEIKDMGKVLSHLMPKLKGRADGALVSKIIKDLLS